MFVAILFRKSIVLHFFRGEDMVDFQQSESIAKLADALAKAQKHFGKAVKDKTAGAGRFSYSYADLNSVLEAVKDALSEQGLSVVQSPVGVSGLVTQLMHASGEYLRTFMDMPIKDNMDPQKRGSAITYARRYALMSVLGIAGADDDAQSAMQPPRHAPQKPAEPVEPWPGFDAKLKTLATLAKECGIETPESFKAFLAGNFNIKTKQDFTPENMETIENVFTDMIIELTQKGEGNDE
jgi:hypothetical protein